MFLCTANVGSTDQQNRTKDTIERNIIPDIT